ncbi:3-deoxy-7-phosphoheptulonate synthase [Candidatus Woesearchaeota archaeon]|nr:3-deoxy-7-phosphoheptulonate synthase [Candidatus Woesearchaeota archaeon]
MIIVLKRNAKRVEVKEVLSRIERAKLEPVPLYGQERTVIAAVGDERKLNRHTIANLPGVEKVHRIHRPYQLASREAKKQPSKVRVGNVIFGGQKIIIIAGPCAVESKGQIMKIARAAKKAGAVVLRGGAFKPRTGPYDFQGLEEKGLKFLEAAGKETGLKTVTEVLDPRDVKLVAKYADILQIGTRNMCNYPLLKEVGKTKKPVLLKRGMSSTYDELLLSAEYIMSRGNREVILCERGIRTFEKATRNTLDISAVPLLKELTHLPIIVDPSHASGKRSLVAPLSKAAIAAGADGLMIEVHTDPSKAVSDAEQTINITSFTKLMVDLGKIAMIGGRGI